MPDRRKLAALFNGVADLSKKLERKAFKPEPAKATEGLVFTAGGETQTVGPKCDQNAGRWVCTTHGQMFDNQMQKDGHIHRNPSGHVLAWHCFHHGPEVP